MRITKVKVANFRNIHGIVVDLDPECNYIIGENNIGKSNFLALLDIVFSGASFTKEDYAHTKMPIVIEIEFAPPSGVSEGQTAPKMTCRQSLGDISPVINLQCLEQSQAKLNLVRYDTSFAQGRGSGADLDMEAVSQLMLKSFIKKYLSGNKAAGSSSAGQLSGLVGYVNGRFSQIPAFRGYSVAAPKEHVDTLAGLLSVSSQLLDTRKTRNGRMQIPTAPIGILSQLLDLSENNPFKDRVFIDSKGKKALPVTLLIDEPEAHLHPYLQRSLISYCKRILRGEENHFSELLRLCFNVDRLDGQLVVVTHSTDPLIGNYKNLVRFYRYGNRTAVIGGSKLVPKFSPSNEKHMAMRFPEIKEAFYARCALLVEGESEYGCISSFAEKMGYVLDDFGICVINARGEGSIRPLRQLLGLFSVPSVAIYDGDTRPFHKPARGEFYTVESCFEIEVVANLYRSGRKDVAKQIAYELDANYSKRVLDVSLLNKHFRKAGAATYTAQTYESPDDDKRELGAAYTPQAMGDINEDNEEEFCSIYSAFFMSMKGVFLGRVIGSALSANLIPDCYKAAIKKALELAAK
ncbi:MAG: AAA family ATPase [Eubacteriaceae bacterium]|nr:AAA family ATPase [Eubacteriaceae bacterium]